jgi:hypothetical protein
VNSTVSWLLIAMLILALSCAAVSDTEVVADLTDDTELPDRAVAFGDEPHAVSRVQTTATLATARGPRLPGRLTTALSSIEVAVGPPHPSPTASRWSAT